MKIYPSNTVTNFSTQLPDSLFLDGDWEVGLAEIQYPYTWDNIRSEKTRPTLQLGMKVIIYLFGNSIRILCYLQVETIIN